MLPEFGKSPTPWGQRSALSSDPKRLEHAVAGGWAHVHSDLCSGCADACVYGAVTVQWPDGGELVLVDVRDGVELGAGARATSAVQLLTISRCA